MKNGNNWPWPSSGPWSLIGGLIILIGIWQTVAYVFHVPYSAVRGWQRSKPWRDAIRNLPKLTAAYQEVVNQRDELTRTCQQLVTMVGNLEKQHQEVRTQMKALEDQTLPDRMDALEGSVRGFVQRHTEAHIAYEQGIGGNVTAVGQQASGLRRETAELTERVKEMEQRAGIHKKQPPS